MAIFELTPNKIKKIKSTTFQEKNILERQHLQALLRDQIEIISPETLIIAEEFSEWEGSRKRIDLLGIDKEANLVVIELKRNDSGDHMELQAIRYASMISTFTFNNCTSIFQKYLLKRGIDKDAQTEILDFLEWQQLKDDFGNDIKIILASQDFSKELTTSVSWLNERNLDIKCIKMTPYNYEGKTLLDINQIIPVPEIEEFQLKNREKSNERRNSRRSERDKTKYILDGEIYGKGKLVLAVIKKYVGNNPNLKLEQLLEIFPKEIQGSNGVLNELSFVLEKFKNQENKRHYLKDEDIVNVCGKSIVVSSQWGIGNIEGIIKIAKELNYEIEIISDGT